MKEQSETAAKRSYLADGLPLVCVKVLQDEFWDRRNKSKVALDAIASDLKALEERYRESIVSLLQLREMGDVLDLLEGQDPCRVSDRSHAVGQLMEQGQQVMGLERWRRIRSELEQASTPNSSG